MSAADPRRHTFTFKIEQVDNGSFVASVIHEADQKIADDVGALYYVVAVIFIYGCSILMMIASYIRKNNADQKLNRYLKDMASVRKREQQWQLFNAAAKAAAHTGYAESGQQQHERTTTKPLRVSVGTYSDVSEGETDWEQDGATQQDGRRASTTSTSRTPDSLKLQVPPVTYATDSDNEDSAEGDTSERNGGSGGGNVVVKLKPQKSILKSCKSVTLVVPEEDWSSTQKLLPTSSPKSPRDSDSRSTSVSIRSSEDMTPFQEIDGLQVVSTV